MRNRILSLALTLVMCLGLLPVPMASASASVELSQNYEVFVEKEATKIQMGTNTFDENILHYGLRDKAGNVVIPAKYAGMYLYKGLIIAAGKGTKYETVSPFGNQEPVYGIIDLNQNVLVPFEYDSIYPIDTDSNPIRSDDGFVYGDLEKASGYLVTKKGGLSGIITESVQTVIPPKYSGLGYLGDGYFNVSDTHNSDADGFLTSWGDNKFGVCDSTGKLIVPIQYDGIGYWGGGYFSVRNGLYVGVINSKCETILPMEYAYVKDRYEGAFIVAAYTDANEADREDAKHIIDAGYPYWGPLLVTYGIVDTQNRPLTDMTKYAKITVDQRNGVFTCYLWNGEVKPARFSVAGTAPSYEYVYEYDFINYSQLGAPVSQPETPAPSQPSTPAPASGSCAIPDSKGLAEFSAAPLRTYKDTIPDLDNWDGSGDVPDVEVTVYEVANGTKLMLTDTAKQKGYHVSRLGGSDFSEDELTLYPTGPKYGWYLLMAGGETYEEVDANSVTLYIRPINQGASSFQDVKASDYYSDAIQWAVKYGVTTGTSATAFSPNDTCTVGQILTFLWRADGMEESWEYGEKKFGNIARNDYYYYAAQWALNCYEMVSGADFAANTPCTRAMVAEYLWKMSYCPTPNAASSFTDVPAGAGYAQAVNWMVEKGITTGTSTTAFSPNDICTRGQIATFIYRYYTLLDLD